jgi:hypothetical protein
MERKSMARISQPKVARQPRHGLSVSTGTAAKHPVIDNRKYPSTEEVGRILNVPARRVRQLKDLAAKKLKTVEVVP